jgi:NAD(P)H-flavin reductase
MGANQCVDAGSEFCPCYLAETNDCIICSHLQGVDYCNCNWCGTCIYQEYIWNGNKSKIKRVSNKFPVISREKIGDNSILMKIQVSRVFARQLMEPGAYVFLRSEDKETYYDVPMSITDSDDISGVITIAAQIIGTKTKMLDSTEEYILVRGPYWGGLFGQKHIKKLQNSSALLISRGIAQGPALLLGKKIIRANNKILFVIDKGRVEKNFIKEEVEKIGAEYIELDLLDGKSNQIILDLVEKMSPGLVFSGGSDKQHEAILKILNDNKIQSPLVITNNSEICCGEGICGSCSTKIEKGVHAKACKTQIDVEKVIERRVLND